MTSSLEIGTKPRDISCCIEEICISQLLAGVLCRCIHAKLSFNYLFICRENFLSLYVASGFQTCKNFKVNISIEKIYFKIFYFQNILSSKFVNATAIFGTCKKLKMKTLIILILFIYSFFLKFF